MGQKYLSKMDGSTTEEGITKSWFHAWDRLQRGHHSMILNSFGVDTRKVICRTLHNEVFALQLTVNFELWDARDRKKFEDQYETKLAIPQSETESDRQKQIGKSGEV